MENEDDEFMPDINSSDTNTPADTMNNQSPDHNDLYNLRQPHLHFFSIMKMLVSLILLCNRHHKEKKDK